MLDFTLNKHHTGLTLWGDESSLACLHRLIHDVVEHSVAIEDKEGFVLGLAYDVRKAQEGQRRKKRIGRAPDKTSLYGVEILWPVVLVQTGVLRHAMGFMPTSKRDQSIMFEFEYVVEAAVRAAAGTEADDIIETIYRVGAAPYDRLDEVVSSRCVYFIRLPAKARTAAIGPLLRSFESQYQFGATAAARDRRDIPPGAFSDADDDWPDFEW